MVYDQNHQFCMDYIGKLATVVLYIKFQVKTSPNAFYKRGHTRRLPALVVLSIYARNDLHLDGGQFLPVVGFLVLG